MRARDFEILSVAEDAQGARVAAPFVKKAGVTYTVVVDRENLVAGGLLGSKAIPLYAMIDELGILRFKSLGGPGPGAYAKIDEVAREDVARPPRREPAPTINELRGRCQEHPDDVASRLAMATLLHMSGNAEEALDTIEQVLELEPKNAAALFRRGVLYLDLELPEDALESFRDALELDPGNWLIRKQIWAIEHPDKFYDGRVDFDWQREQMKRERGG